MSQEPELPSDSDEDDVDYVPDGAEAPGSEVESEGDAESGIEDDHDENKHVSAKKKRGNQRKGAITKRRLAIDCRETCEDSEPEEKKILTEQEEKQKADSLWADFMKDTGSVSKPVAQKTVPKQDEKTAVTKPRAQETVKITKIFEFAGEEVKVEEEVSANSVAARLALSSAEKCEEKPTKRPPKRVSGGLGGMRSVLGQIGKKPKISTLEKSKLDWANFKKEQQLDDEINTHNRGKDGYLERQDFLQRTDLRQFENEKKLRTMSRRSNR